ncbi:hypothetical protein PDIDSM_9083 [Penicillium digitatum]|nr:hypothetical protein PDIDSM_9083 [Penicillium digitatum]
METSDFVVSAAGSKTFHPFTRLPTELRLQIWRSALPERDKPAFTPYPKGGWLPVAPESQHASNIHQAPVEWKFCPQSLDQIRVKIPLADVNHEARQVALKWAHKQGFEVIFHNDRQCFIFLRPFEPMRDLIWIGGDEFELFIDECWGVHESAHSPENVSLPIKVGHFAVPVNLLIHDRCLTSLADTLRCFSGDIVLYIIADEHPSFNVIHGNHTKVQPRWELHDTLEGETMVWERKSKTFEVELGPRLFNENSIQYERILEGSQLIACVLGRFMPNVNFEIRAAAAIRL